MPASADLSCGSSELALRTIRQRSQILSVSIFDSRVSPVFLNSVCLLPTELESAEEDSLKAFFQLVCRLRYMRHSRSWRSWGLERRFKNLLMTGIMVIGFTWMIVLAEDTGEGIVSQKIFPIIYTRLTFFRACWSHILWIEIGVYRVRQASNHVTRGLHRQCFYAIRSYKRLPQPVPRLSECEWSSLEACAPRETEYDEVCMPKANLLPKYSDCRISHERQSPREKR